MALTLNLVPLIVLTIWVLFTFSNNLMVNLIALLSMSLALPIQFMDKYKVFWPCSLLLVLISTGLIVIFGYIVSLHHELSKSNSFYIIPSTLFILLMTHSMSGSKTENFYSLNLWPSSEVLVSAALLTILLILIISFVRLVYSKGGGFRKKY